MDDVVRDGRPPERGDPSELTAGVKEFIVAMKDVKVAARLHSA